MWKSKEKSKENSKEKLKKKKAKRKKKRHQKKKNKRKMLLHDCKHVFLRDVGVIWCNFLDDSHFQIYVIDNVELYLIFIYMSHF